MRWIDFQHFTFSPPRPVVPLCLLDFLGLKGAYSEKDLEAASNANLQQPCCALEGVGWPREAHSPMRS